jgi:hypothetical protein
MSENRFGVLPSGLVAQALSDIVATRPAATTLRQRGRFVMAAFPAAGVEDGTRRSSGGD